MTHDRAVGGTTEASSPQTLEYTLKTMVYCIKCGATDTDGYCCSNWRSPKLRTGTWRDVEKARARIARRHTILMVDYTTTNKTGRSSALVSKNHHFGPYQERPDPRSAVRAMSELQAQQAGQVGRSLLARIPYRARRAILDADFLRRRLAYAGKGGTPEIEEQLLRICAKIGNPEGKPEDDPIFWVLGIWRSFGPPPFTPVDVEPRVLRSNRKSLSRGLAPSPLAYATLAAWACRRSAPQPEVGPLCLQIRDEIRDRDRNRAFSFPLPETTAWLHWLGSALQRPIPWPHCEMGTSDTHRTRWEKVGLGPDDAGRILVALQAIRHPARPRHALQETGVPTKP